MPNKNRQSRLKRNTWILQMERKNVQKKPGTYDKISAGKESITKNDHS